MHDARGCLGEEESDTDKERLRERESRASHDTCASVHDYLLRVGAPHISGAALTSSACPPPLPPLLHLFGGGISTLTPPHI